MILKGFRRSKAFSIIYEEAGLYYKLNENNQKISFWHDIPLQYSKNNSSDAIYNCVIEVPRNRLGKWECSKDIPLNPIIQDRKKNPFDEAFYLPRFYPLFPLFNYGYLPQTIEHPELEALEGLRGDGDPVDIVHLSHTPAKIGEVIPVRIIGGLPLVDQGEFDAKLLAVDLDNVIKSINQANQKH